MTVTGGLFGRAKWATHVEYTRRAEIIGYINEGLLPTPYDKSYNLADYDELVAQANANREAGLSVWGHEGK